MQLLAIAKTSDMKTYGPSSLLSDFVQTINMLSDGGIIMELHGDVHNVKGALAYVPADTPASNWLGGFKQGVSFSYKICRTCNASNNDIKQQFCESDFTMRDIEVHKRRSQTIESLRKEGKQHFSKLWGINNSSVLNEIHHFNVCQNLVHDPMHLFLEGLVKTELQLVLFDQIINKKNFKLSWLTHQIEAYPYSYLQKDSKPEAIDRKQVLGLTPFKQTASAVMTLCEILPHKIGLKADIDPKWLNFLRLVQCLFISTTPICNADTTGMLTQLIFTHHQEFRKLYPKATITPKMHYCIHLPTQMKEFGPLRHLWCMRFEGKHGFFKSKKWKCLKNLPLSMAKKHQLHACHKQTMSNGLKNPNYLYAGDMLREGSHVVLSELYPDLSPFFQGVFDDFDDSTQVYHTTSAVIHGINYQVGCILLLAVENWVPVFGLCIDIVAHKDCKFFIVERSNTEYYIPNFLSYKIERTGELLILPQKTMTFKWPSWPQKLQGQTVVLYRYLHFTEHF